MKLNQSSNPSMKLPVYIFHKFSPISFPSFFREIFRWSCYQHVILVTFKCPHICLDFFLDCPKPLITLIPLFDQIYINWKRNFLIFSNFLLSNNFYFRENNFVHLANKKLLSSFCKILYQNT